MASAAPPKPTIAFFGATGGSVLSALSLALQDGYKCTALARTPSKLTSLLQDRGIPASTLFSNLHITTGDVRSLKDVTATLTFPSSSQKENGNGNGNSPSRQGQGQSQGQKAQIIISGIGATSLTEIFSRVDLCETAMKNIVQACRDTYSPPAQQERKEETSPPPLLVALSTTGITSSGAPRDIPLAYIPLYHTLGHFVHADKYNMEKVLAPYLSSSSTSSPSKQFINAVIVRPSLLTNGPMLGPDAVREGREGDPAVGYTISREDVGSWVFRRCVLGRGEGVLGERVSITY